MKIKVLIVEDEALIAEEIAECIIENGFEVTEIVATSNGALRSIQEKKPDVILMDISIKGEENGITLSKKILQIDNFPIIFLTSSTENTVVKEATEIRPSAFLLKPFSEKELPIAIELAFTNHNAELLNKRKPILKDSIFVKSGKKFEKIKLEEILYLEAQGSYSNIITKKGSYIISYNLSHFQEEIEHVYFLRIHRSYIINIENVDSFDNASVTLNDKTLPVSKQFTDKFQKALKKI